MPRYIDAEQIPYHHLPVPVFEDDAYMYANKCDILAMPTVDVEEVRHGKWVKNDIYVYTSDGNPVVKIGEEYVCSLCGRAEKIKEPYCNCGAKMD